MFYNKILLITDNPVLFKSFTKLISGEEYKDIKIDYRHSPNNSLFNVKSDVDISPIVIKDSVKELIENYNLIISLHCKQLFPIELIEKIKCINVHPGFNPINRGWYPQIFSIINQSVMGATIHEIDECIDHGDIICRTEVPSYSWDTSLSAYYRIMEAEMKLLEENLLNILNNNYTTFKPESKGNLYLKKDFNELCKLDLNEENNFGYFINKLRALTHENIKNAFFIDKATNKKVYVRLILEPEE